MYTKLHITRTDTSSTGAKWGYTTYNGVSGWVCLVETSTYDPQLYDVVVPHEDTDEEEAPEAAVSVPDTSAVTTDSADSTESAEAPDAAPEADQAEESESAEEPDSSYSSAKTLLIGAGGGVVVLLLALGVSAASRKRD
jgi:hypothetical protein